MPDVLKSYYYGTIYKSVDVERTIWLQHELEINYPLASFNGCMEIRKDCLLISKQLAKSV